MAHKRAQVRWSSVDLRAAARAGNVLLSIHFSCPPLSLLLHFVFLLVCLAWLLTNAYDISLANYAHLFLFICITGNFADEVGQPRHLSCVWSHPRR